MRGEEKRARQRCSQQRKRQSRFLCQWHLMYSQSTPARRTSRERSNLAPLPADGTMYGTQPRTLARHPRDTKEIESSSKAKSEPDCKLAPAVSVGAPVAALAATAPFRSSIRIHSTSLHTAQDHH